MSENNKQSRRENKDTYVINPQKSADPPQPQGKNRNTINNQPKGSQMK